MVLKTDLGDSVLNVFMAYAPESCRFFGAIGKRYKLFWMGSKAKTDGVGIFLAEK